MNIDSLRYFQYVSKYKNITEAAKNLFTSQSTLSRQLISLENEIGVQLLNRNNKQITLTSAGQAMANEIDSFLHHYDSMLQVIKKANNPADGLLRITLPDHLNYYLLQPIIKMQKLYPTCQIFVENYAFNEIPTAVAFDIYDIGVTYDYAIATPSEFDIDIIGTDEFSIIFPRSYEEKYQEDELISKIVCQLPLFLPRNIEPPFLNKAKNFLQDYSKTPIDTISVNNTESIISNVSLSLGYSIVPRFLAHTLAKRSTIAAIELTQLESTCNIVMLRRNDFVQPIVKSFTDLVQKL